MLFGEYTLAQIRACSLLAERPLKGLSARELAGLLGVHEISNARRLLNRLVSAELVVPAPPGEGGPTRGAPRRFHPAAALLEDPAETVAQIRVTEPLAPDEEAPKKNGAQPSVKRRRRHDDLTERCVEVLLEVPGFPGDLSHVARYVKDYRCAFPLAEPLTTCQEYRVFHQGKPANYTKNHLRRLRKFFEVRQEDGERAAHAATGTKAGRNSDRSRRSPTERGATGQGRKPGARPKPSMPVSDPKAEREKARLCDEISAEDGISRQNLFKSLVATGVGEAGTLVLVAEDEEYANYVREKWAEIFVSRGVEIHSAAQVADGPRATGASALGEEKTNAKVAS